MHGSKVKSAYNQQIREEATEWFIRFCEEEMEATSRREFDAWLRASPEHVRAFLDIAALWEAAGTLGRANKVTLEELVRRAREEGNVVPLERGRRPGAPERTAGKLLLRQFLSHRPPAIAASILAACLVVVSVTWWYLAGDPSYVTRIGERRAVTLEDGSTVEMNVRTRIKVHFTDTLRTVDLVEGQALFRVAKETNRPFVVNTGNTRVRAVGTEFDVYRKSIGTVVTVVEGRVAVSTPPGSSYPVTPPVSALAPVLIGAGEQVTVTARKTGAPQRADASQVTAWTEGKLKFDSTPLSEVVQEFNRYNTRPLAVDDTQLLALHISGTFATSDSAQIVSFLAQRFELTVHETPEAIHLVHQ